MMLCSFPEAKILPETLVGREAKWLSQTTNTATGFVITSNMEEMFYISNNLPEQLRGIFKNIEVKRLDEDALEQACQKAQHLIINSFLLDDQIQQIELAWNKLGLGNSHFRRPEASGNQLANDKRTALLALKRIWAEDWKFEAVLTRLDFENNIGIEARPSYIFAGGAGTTNKKLSEEASTLLGRKVLAYANEFGLVKLQQ